MRVAVVRLSLIMAGIGAVAAEHPNLFFFVDDNLSKELAGDDHD